MVNSGSDEDLSGLLTNGILRFETSRVLSKDFDDL